MRSRFLMMVGATCSIGCELVLGDLPPAKKHDSAASTGVGGTASSSGGGSGGIAASGGGGNAGSTASSGGGGGTASSGGGGTASSSTASGGGTTSTGGAGGCCDCDGDGVNAAGLCGGTDCDDGDLHVFPGEPIFFAVASPNPAIGFDWDCNGKPEQDPTMLQTIDCGLIGLPCAAGTGYLATVPPACGQGAPWGTCKQNGLGCVKSPIDQNRIMKCK